MRVRELIRLMPTQYKRISDSNPLYAGHFIPLLGTWSEDEGYINKQSLEYKGEVLACPIIGVVDEKFGNKDITLTIKGKIAEYWKTTEKEEEGYTIKKKLYQDSGAIQTGTLTIPRYTRPRATFLITELGKNIFEITSITGDKTQNVGKISFYALASNGSKIIYWMGIHKLAMQLKSILRPWISPSKCSRCSGTGIEPNTESEICVQCNGYKYSGYSSEAYVQRMRGYDVGIAREILDWNNLSVDDHKIIWKFVNKCWSQKWWVTPTKSEIKRLFAQMYNTPEGSIVITERFNMQEPVWKIELPEKGFIGSPFAELTTEDRALMQYIAESVTPAGVSVFLGFYRDFILGDLEGFSDKVWVVPILESSLEHQYELWGMPRWDFYNGWTEAVDDFEREGAIGWDINGSVDIFNANDMNRHVARLQGNSYMQSGISAPTGCIEAWIHPQDTEMRFGIVDSVGSWICYLEFDENGFYDNNGYLLTYAKPDNDYHIRIDYDNGIQKYDVSLMLEKIESGINYIGSGSVSKLRISSQGTGYGFIDAIGVAEHPIYNKGDNWQRLYPWGWGIKNNNYATGATGTVYNLMENYFRRDRFFNVNI